MNPAGMGDLDSILFTKEYFLQDNICRFCWAKDALIDCTLKSPLFFKVEYCLNIDLSQDDTIYYPKKVCQTCFSKIEQFHEFKTFCHNANEQLTEILENDLDNSSTQLESLEEIKVESTALSFESDLVIESQKHDSSVIKNEEDGNKYSPKNNVVNKSLKNLQKSKSTKADVKPTQSGHSNISCEDSNDTFSKHKSFSFHVSDNREVKFSDTKSVSQKSTAEIAIKRHSSTYCKSCCEEFYDEATFIEHKDDAHGIEKNGKYRCFGCGKLFLQRVSRLQHESQKCSALEKGYKCVLCDSYLPTRGIYEKHMKNHRLNKEVDLPENEIFECDKCGEQFPSRRCLVLHMKNNGHNKKKTVVKTHDKSSTYCRKCNENFPDEENCIKHRSEEHGVEKDGRYRCFGCGKLFTNRVSCLSHEVKACPQLVDGYKCSLCDTFAQTRNSHEQHMKNHRLNKMVQALNEHTFRCTKCGEEFTKKSEWRAHSKQHFNKKEYICETCGKAFASITYLRSHGSTHTGERKYQCAHCDYRCTQKNNLIIHMRRHTKERPFACDLCPARTSTRASLQTHQLTHSGIKPFECPYDNCGKKFSHRKSLKEHIEINHEGSAFNPCTLCGQNFLRAGHLRRHLKKKHPEEAKLIKKKTPGRKPNYEMELA